MTAFPFDAFFSHALVDTGKVVKIAEQLVDAGLNVWFSHWVTPRAGSIDAQVASALSNARCLVVFVSSESVSASRWREIDEQALPFRDTRELQRRLVFVLFDGVSLPSSLADVPCLIWSSGEEAIAIQKLVALCEDRSARRREDVRKAAVYRRTFKGGSKHLWRFAFSRDAKRVIVSGSETNDIFLFDTNTGKSSPSMTGHKDFVHSISWSPDEKYFVSGSYDGAVKVWDISSLSSTEIWKDDGGKIKAVAFSNDGEQIAYGGDDEIVRVYNCRTRETFVVGQHADSVEHYSWSADDRYLMSCSFDQTACIWDVAARRVSVRLVGHNQIVRAGAFVGKSGRVVTGSDEGSLRLWDADSGRCIRVFEGHLGWVLSLAANRSGTRIVSGSTDKSFRVWDATTGECLHTFRQCTSNVEDVAWSEDESIVIVGSIRGELVAVNVPEASGPVGAGLQSRGQIQYTNAKVLIVGESGAGKTALTNRLVHGSWTATDSTVGAWATQWKFPIELDGTMEREVWMWDFGGQADQRLIHQLYMNDAAVAVLVFDGQKDGLFESLGQWDRELVRASDKRLKRILAMGRCDAGPLRVSRESLLRFAEERGIGEYVETSAKHGTGCDRLKGAITEAIDWNNVPWRTSPVLFKRLREEVIGLKDEGLVIIRFKELRDKLRLILADDNIEFQDDELRAVIGLLSSPGAVWELDFGTWILLQPELINVYAQAVIQTLRADPLERGCISEAAVLGGDLLFHAGATRLNSEDERIVLLAMHQRLVAKAICLREFTEEGTLLVFPSFYRRERPELEGHPEVHVSFVFAGPLDEIYASLIVRFHHSKLVNRASLWRYGADFTTHTGKRLGVKLQRLPDGKGDLSVYFESGTSEEERILFSKYVHEHLLSKASEVTRFRHYVCNCGTPVGNRDVAMRRLNLWLKGPGEEGEAASVVRRAPDIICAECEGRVALWDKMESVLAGAKIRKKVRQLQEASNIVLDNESKERALVGEVITTVSMAGQLSREFSVSDHGIDMEIEFKSDQGEATGRKIYLQLKSGDSHLRRRSDKSEVFAIKDSRHAEYWSQQKFPVFLVVRDSRGLVRWMEISRTLKEVAKRDGGILPKSIEFNGEIFDSMSVRRLRERELA